MKTAILVLTILGALGAAFLGLTWMADASKVRDAVEMIKKTGLGDDPKIKAKISEAESLVTAAYFLLFSAVVAVGVIVASRKIPNKEKIFGGVLIGCALLPAIFAIKTLVFTFFFVIAGGLTLAKAFPASSKYLDDAVAKVQTR